MTLLIAVGSVKLPGHVRPRLTYPIRVVFHIDTTRSETCGPARRGAGPTSWAGQAEAGPDLGGLGRARRNWAACEEAGLRGTLGRRKRWVAEDFGPQTDWAERAGLITFAGLGWGDSIGLNLHKPKRWAEPVRGRAPENTKKGGERGSDGLERWFPPLGTAATVQEGAGGSGEHRLGCAVLETGVTRLGPVRISSFSLLFFEKTESERARLGVDFARDPPPFSSWGCGVLCGIELEREGKRQGSVPGKRAVACRASVSVVAGGRGGWATTVCRRWQRDFGERRGEEEGGEEKRRKEWRGGKEEEEKKRGRSGKKERAGRK
ncbi:hypothetical protein CRG98_009537 [Punica granatum]|uniref:Uncharacterized protein n=1 Tax=Punica granatum TaxID=22663 RepID=A0A2I0KNL1_PUNGR|nr:hypothetical protein CRG98_009537 [Punica granatum]